MGVGIDAKLYTLGSRQTAPAPVQIQPVPTAVYLDDLVMRNGGLDDLRDIDAVSCSRQEKPACGMAEHGHIGISQGPADAARLVVFGKIEAAVH